ncbi:hypothetical protein [Arthrobacter antibioticus]|uniref:hypothetical protein n=1 Tax=Arthrobacter sp. H35-MC1 TaxID=3046203 RepID=UPI0024BB1D1C|nr:hypothetical protein [Arthrobacter sp. H35-MC1]MDJ0318608.1 hypothetical protein [Arthrobacter sp. H35-MC1]
MACNKFDVVCKGKEDLENAITGAIDSGAQDMGKIMMTAWDSVMKSFLTSWLDVGLMVQLDAGSVPWLTQQLHTFSVFFAVIGVMIACIWTMVHARGDKAIQVSKSLFRVFLVTTLGTVLIQVVLAAGDSFSTWVLESAGISSDGYEVIGYAAGLAPGIAIIAGIFGVIATLFQWGIMMVRAVVLPLLVAVWPLSAAASMVQGGEETFSKVTKWLVAFLLYKPVAAIVYAFAWKMKSGDDGVGGVISGMLLLVLAVAALPALMKLVSPGTTALGGAAGGGMAMAAGAAVVSAGVAVGAAVVTGGSSAGATAGSAGTTAASTSTTTASTAQGTGTAMTEGGAATTGSSPASNTGSSALGSDSSSPSGPQGEGGADGSDGSGTAGDSGPSGSSAPGSGEGGSSSSGGSSAEGSSGSRSGLQAGAQSLGGTVADGGKDSDGTDVIGE